MLFTILEHFEVTFEIVIKVKYIFFLSDFGINIFFQQFFLLKVGIVSKVD